MKLDLSDARKIADAALRVVTQEAGIEVADILKGLRQAPYTHARWTICWIMYHEFGVSYPRIGHELALHHTSALYGVRKIDEAIKSDPTNEVLLTRLTRAVRRELAMVDSPDSA